MKKISVILLFFFTNFVNAQGECEPGTLVGVTANFSTSNTYHWLYKDIPIISSTSQFKGSDPGGGGCKHAIEITSTSDVTSDYAHYTREHNDSSEVNFRFILSTDQLLENFVAGDKIVFYSFKYKDQFNTEIPLLKVRLIKSHTEGINDHWYLKLQWFNNITGASIHQKFDFSEAEEFVEFEFFWKKFQALNSSLANLYKTVQAGVIIKSGNGINDKPHLFMSPYRYNHHIGPRNLNLVGKSRLGIINSSSNALHLGDRIKIYSADLYED